MTSISTQPTAISPVTAGAPEAPPGQSPDSPTSFAAVIAPLTATPSRQGGTLPGKVLPVAPSIDPKPDDRTIETAVAGPADESSDEGDKDKPGLADDSGRREIDPVLGWFGVAATPAAVDGPGAPVSPQRPPSTIESIGISTTAVAPESPTTPTLGADRTDTPATPLPAPRDIAAPVSPVRPLVTLEAPPATDPATPGFARFDHPTTPILGGDRSNTPATVAQSIPAPAAHPVSPQRPDPAIDGAAIASTLSHGRDVSPLQPRPRNETSILTGATLAATATLLPQAVSAVATADQAPLDLTRHGWPQAMIDRIETLRDNADAVDTRIRIVPDALGTIDVSVRRQGDVTHVHFAADQAQTRHILADAQPRLAELAESRGLKLAQSGVDAGAGQRQRQQPAAFVPGAPPRARRAEAAADHRIA